MTDSQGWIGVDLDGTLAHYEGFQGLDHIGPPIPAMVARVKQWRTNGLQVRIVTARYDDGPPAWAAVQVWCLEHVGEILPVTNAKDRHMYELWDDRAVQVVRNTGIPLQEAAQQITEALRDVLDAAAPRTYLS